jgi:hypothetical protein
VIKIQQLFLRPAACLTPTLLESRVGTNDCKCSRDQRLNVPSVARRNWSLWKLLSFRNRKPSALTAGPSSSLSLCSQAMFSVNRGTSRLRTAAPLFSGTADLLQLLVVYSICIRSNLHLKWQFYHFLLLIYFLRFLSYLYVKRSLEIVKHKENYVLSFAIKIQLRLHLFEIKISFLCSGIKAVYGIRVGF